MALCWRSGSDNNSDEVFGLDEGRSMNDSLSRRQWLGGISATAATGLAATCSATGQEAKPTTDPFTYCLNTATIRGQSLAIVDKVELGYQAIEPWINELERHVEKGGSLRDLGRRITDAGLRVPSVIGFAEWIVDDEGQRRKGLERARREWTWCAKSAARASPHPHPVPRRRRSISSAPPNVIGPCSRSATRSVAVEFESLVEELDQVVGGRVNTAFTP
jgi:hypothetical protein